jgi:hypothetical protein
MDVLIYNHCFFLKFSIHNNVQNGNKKNQVNFPDSVGNRTINRKSVLFIKNESQNLLLQDKLALLLITKAD